MRRMLSLAAILLLPSALFAADTTHRYVVATRVAFQHGMLGSIGRAGVEPQTIETERNVLAFESVNGFAADMTEAEAAELAKSPSVRYVELAKERHILDVTRNWDGQTLPWGVTSVKATSTWQATRGNGVNVVVIDTGIDYTHPELAPVYAGGINEIISSATPMDDNGHGTHVSGTIAAADNNAGVVGVAPNVKLWAVKVLNAKGSGSNDKIIKAIDWIINQKRTLGGNWVISLSLGSADPDDLEQAAFQRASDNGILAVAASGNESTSAAPAPIGYPAGYPTVLSVGAIDSTSTIAVFSNQGPTLGLVGPGVDVLSTVPVGSGSIADVVSGSTRDTASNLTGSPQKTVSGPFVYCGFGSPSEIPSGVRGKIAVIKRGNNITFHDKTQNAKAAGAIAVVVFNNQSSGMNWTLIGGINCDATGANCTDNPADLSYDWPLTVGISQADGEALVATPNASISVSSRKDDYGILSGTSMATPHVSAVAALVWSLAPTATAEQIKTALFNSATDLGTPGRDNVYGFGEANALAAAMLVAPQAFGSSAMPAPKPPTQPVTNHPTLKRGHR